MKDRRSHSALLALVLVLDFALVLVVLVLDRLTTTVTMTATFAVECLCLPSTIEAVVCCNLGSKLQHDANIESRHDLLFDFYSFR